MQQIIPIQNRDQLRELSPNSTPQSQKLDAERLEQAGTLAKKLLAGKPNYAGATALYLSEIGECVAGYEPEMQAKILDLKTGVPARCKFLPTPADIAEFVREEAEKVDRYRPAHTAYGRFKPNTGRILRTPEEKKAYEDWAEKHADKSGPSAEERKAQVVEALAQIGQWGKADSLPTPPPLECEDFHTNADLRTPPAPPSQKLIDLVARQKEHNPNELWC